MLNITRQGASLLLTADPPETVRFRHPTGQFFPSREGRAVGTGAAAWEIDNSLKLPLKFQRLKGGDWVDAGSA